MLESTVAKYTRQTPMLKSICFRCEALPSNEAFIPTQQDKFDCPLKIQTPRIHYNLHCKLCKIEKYRKDASLFAVSSLHSSLALGSARIAASTWIASSIQVQSQDLFHQVDWRPQTPGCVWCVNKKQGMFCKWQFLPGKMMTNHWIPFRVLPFSPCLCFRCCL